MANGTIDGKVMDEEGPFEVIAEQVGHLHRVTLLAYNGTARFSIGDLYPTRDLAEKIKDAELFKLRSGNYRARLTGQYTVELVRRIPGESQ